MQFFIDNLAWLLLIAGFSLLAVIGKLAEARKERQREEIELEIDAKEAQEAVAAMVLEEKEEPVEAPTEEITIVEPVEPEAPADGMEFNMDAMTTPPAPEAPVEETKEVEIDEFGIEEMPALMTAVEEEKPADGDVWEFK